MIDLFLTVYDKLYGSNCRNNYKRSNHILWLFCNVGYRLIENAFYYYLKLFFPFIHKCNDSAMNDGVVISLTSYPARIQSVYMVILSLLRQSITPFKICLYLSEEDFPNKEKELPSRLVELVSNLFEIRWVGDNLMPHKKYYYAMIDFPSRNVITVDDDIYYRPDLVKRLLDLHQRFPSCACANTKRRITFDTNSGVCQYNAWEVDYTPFKPSYKYVAIGYNGVLYPANIFSKSNILNKDKIKTLCLKADDLWLKAHELLNSVKVVSGDFYSQSIRILGAKESSLMSTNCFSKQGQTGNDIQWENLNKEYNINNLLIKYINLE